MKTTKTLIKLEEKDFTKNFYPTAIDAVCEVLNAGHIGGNVVFYNKEYYKVSHFDHFNGYFYNLTLKKLSENEKQHI